jgi:hypothetical protein
MDFPDKDSGFSYIDNVQRCILMHGKLQLLVVLPDAEEIPFYDTDWKDYKLKDTIALFLDALGLPMKDSKPLDFFIGLLVKYHLGFMPLKDLNNYIPAEGFPSYKLWDKIILLNESGINDPDQIVLTQDQLVRLSKSAGLKKKLISIVRTN